MSYLSSNNVTPYFLEQKLSTCLNTQLILGNNQGRVFGDSDHKEIKEIIAKATGIIVNFGNAAMSEAVMSFFNQPKSIRVTLFDDNHAFENGRGVELGRFPLLTGILRDETVKTALELLKEGDEAFIEVKSEDGSYVAKMGYEYGLIYSKMKSLGIDAQSHYSGGLIAGSGTTIEGEEYITDMVEEARFSMGFGKKNDLDVLSSKLCFTKVIHYNAVHFTL